MGNSKPRIMTAIDQIIRQAINPFDPATFKPGNFWHEEQDPALDVESIHQEVIREVEAVLEQVARDHRTRTVMIFGDSGAGKTHVLGRLKRILNPKAFFVYIDPFPESEAIWRHVLRYTVDSLVQKPEGEAESQLLLWLKSLSAFKQGGVVSWVLSDRQRFVRSLKSSYPSGIYNANEFFGMLYDLIDPDRYPLACEWLRGDNLDDESLKLLNVKHSIETEDAAQKVLANFGRIAAETQPIVLCFDQLDNIARTSDGAIDLQALFNVNSSIHNQLLKNFLVIISIITSTWRQNADRVQLADQVRIDTSVPLKPISLDQAEAVWVSRLRPLHRQAEPQPDSPIFPLTRQVLEQKYPGGKTYPRNALELGRRIIQSYKVGPSRAEQPEDAIAAFKLVWLKEFNRVQERITRIRQLSAPELTQMLKETFAALQVGEIRPRFLPSPTYASHSFSYQPNNQGRVGIGWNEDPSLTAFFHIMNACRRAVELNLCEKLFLIRAEDIGKPGNRGYELHDQIFAENTPHQRLKPSLHSVHYLATYHSLVNAAYAGEIVVAGKTLDIQALESFIRDSHILQNCTLLKDLGVLSGKVISEVEEGAIASQPDDSEPEFQPDSEPIQDFLLDLLKTHQLLGRQVMVQTTVGQFTEISEDQVNKLIQQLSEENQLQVLGDNPNLEEQLVYLPNESI